MAQTKNTVPLELLRTSLIEEELSELKLAAWREDWPTFFDAVGDLCYVLVGTAVSRGWVLSNILLQDRKPHDKLETEAVRFDCVHMGRAITTALSRGTSQGGIQQAVYFLDGFCYFHSIPLEEIFNRVHASNMTKKVSGDTRVKDKGPDFRPPVFDDLVETWLARRAA